MDYEKKYNEALEKAKSMINDLRKGEDILAVSDLESMFPELKESEDERIRKALIEMVHDTTGDSLWVDYNVHKEDALAWLEKQGDANKEYWRGYREGKKEILDKYSELEKQVKQNQKHFELKAGHWYICHRAYCCRADHLTVKEGERFMCEKDGIVKGFVIKEPEKYFKEVCAPAPIEDEQKPAWSEEDEKMVNDIIAAIDTFGYFSSITTYIYYNGMVNWLKSLKERCTWKPSDEQMDALQYVYRSCNPLPSDKLGWDSIRTLELMYQELKKLREE